jgi:hypothetical protein
MMKRWLVLGCVGVVGMVVAGCGAAPEDAAGSTEQAVIHPMMTYDCSLLAGSNQALAGLTLGGTVVTPGPGDGAYPWAFEQTLASTLGYMPTIRLAYNTTTKWDYTILTSAQIPTVESLATAWVSVPDVSPGVFFCVFNRGDCLDTGGTPAQCTQPSHTILAYDPRGCQGCM